MGCECIWNPSLRSGRIAQYFHGFPFAPKGCFANGDIVLFNSIRGCHARRGNDPHHRFRLGDLRGQLYEAGLKQDVKGESFSDLFKLILVNLRDANRKRVLKPHSDDEPWNMLYDTKHDPFRHLVEFR